MWLTVFAVTLAAAICFDVSAFMMQHGKLPVVFGFSA
jgi:hypothetical protein